MILVTGGAGFIGSNFISDWVANTNEGVINLDKLTYAGNLLNLDHCATTPSYRFVKADIGDRQTIKEILSTFKPRAVLNFAAESHVDRSINYAEDFISTNIVGTYRLLEEVTEYHNRLTAQENEQFRFLHISTDEVYGTLGPSDPAFTEQHPYDPTSPYAATKAASDHLVTAWHKTYGLPTLITNCSNNYGPLQFPEKLIPLMITRALKNETLPIYGNGQQVRDWLYVADHVSALKKVLEGGRVGEKYNIGGQNEEQNINLVTASVHHLRRTKPPKRGRKL
jgi:dTDP-glucose 4,6-dehydratase